MQKISTKNYKNFLQYFMKNLNQSNFDTILKTAFTNTTPVVGVKTARKGSKNIYVPTRLTPRRGKFLAAK
jgi:ribosomal protein S7